MGWFFWGEETIREDFSDVRFRTVWDETQLGIAAGASIGNSKSNEPSLSLCMYKHNQTHILCTVCNIYLYIYAYVYIYIYLYISTCVHIEIHGDTIYILYSYTYVHVCTYNATYICASLHLHLYMYNGRRWKIVHPFQQPSLAKPVRQFDRAYIYCQILSAPLSNDQTKHLCCYKTAVRNWFFTSVTNKWEITWRSWSQAIPGRITNNPKQKGEQPTNLTTPSTICVQRATARSGMGAFQTTQPCHNSWSSRTH